MSFFLVEQIKFIKYLFHLISLLITSQKCSTFRITVFELFNHFFIFAFFIFIPCVVKFFFLFFFFQIKFFIYHFSTPELYNKI
ncbi:hypothetical protein DRJ19_03440 [Candidatus Woesearchaeota archaeon]|nr:MAG: hypothetical protein DRJ19_03440 [Candidatus Woesearchaeota archaeon]